MFLVEGFCSRVETAILLSSLSQIYNFERKFLKISSLRCSNYSDWRVVFVFLLVEEKRKKGIGKNWSTLGFVQSSGYGWDISK